MSRKTDARGGQNRERPQASDGLNRRDGVDRPTSRAETSWNPSLGRKDFRETVPPCKERMFRDTV